MRLKIARNQAESKSLNTVEIKVKTQTTTIGKKVMRDVLEQQKTWSLIVAIGLAILITVFAAFNSFGETLNEDLNDEDRVEMEILERAYADVQEDSIIEFTNEIEKIKIFDAQNNLVVETALSGNEIIENRNVQVLLNRADFLVKQGNTSIYRITE
jgi:hypothetical protein